MQEIAKIIPQLLRMAQHSEEFAESACAFAWRACVGGAISRVSLPGRLYRKTLKVTVIDETWKRQLERMSGQILFKMNSLLGTTVVTCLEFGVNAEAVRQAHRPLIFPVADTPLTDPTLLEASNRIRNDRLREQFMKTASKYLQSQQERKRQSR